jgi:nucleotide-binding universal stress UspA family protein
MTPRTILAVLEGGPSSETSLRAAFALAGQWGGHVTALCVRPDPRDAAYLVTDTVSGRVVEDVLRAIERDAETRAAEARGLFDRVLAEAGLAGAKHKPTAALEIVVGAEAEVVAGFGRTADLIVVPRAQRETQSEIALEAALFSSGRPVLVTPAEPAAQLAERVVVLWNDTVEAARAATAAMPFLARAGGIEIVLVKEDGDDAQASAGRLAANLLRHGVAAAVTALDAGSKPVMEVIAGFLAKREPSLVVMGAYGHSRLREFVLGGVTRHMLAAPGPALLMAH